MENAVEALKIAVSVMIFAMALTIGISSFSNANSAIDTIINLRDRETEYTYVEPTKESIRTVGIETVVTTMYRAIEQNLEIYCFESDGDTLSIYYAVDSNNNVINESGENIGISSINFAKSENGKFTDKEDAEKFLDVLLGGKYVPSDSNDKKDYYLERLIDNIDDEGLYNKLKDKTFEEKLGEYYEGSGATEIKKRVITYTIKD